MTESIRLPAIKTKPVAIALPGSRSISNRSLPLATLSDNICKIHPLLKLDDTDRTLDTLTALGVKIKFLDGDRLEVCGAGGRLPNRNTSLFLGNADTAFRSLTAVLTVLGGGYSLRGIPRMHERPIDGLVGALRIARTNVCYEGRENYLPLHINEHIDSDAHEIPIRGGMSSQFLTTTLVVSPLTGQAFEIRIVGEPISRPYIDIALKLMARLGVNMANENYRMFKTPADVRYHASEHLYVEGDMSSVSYFLAAGLITDVPVRVTEIGRNNVQGDVTFARELEKIGADILWDDDFIEVSRPETCPAQAFDLDADHTPDITMILVVVALAVDALCTLCNTGSQRVRGTDHITIMAVELCKLDAVTVGGPEVIRITPPGQLRADIIIDTYDDHRIVMRSSLVSLMGAPVVVNDPKYTHRTFPTYFDTFTGLLVG